MKTYDDIFDYFLSQVDTFTPNQLVDICRFLIAEIAHNITDDFMQYELEEEQIPLTKLHQALLQPDLQKQNITNILAELDDIVEEYGDDYPADMEMETMTLINIASAYRNLLDTIEQDSNDKASINADAIFAISTYLDFLDYQASEFDDINTENWGNYPVIKQGIEKLHTYLKQLS